MALLPRQAVDSPLGENKRHRNRYNEMSVAVRKPDKSMAFTLRFRAFDDGIAFRYELAQPDSLAVTDELTEFRFANEGQYDVVVAYPAISRPMNFSTASSPSHGLRMQTRPSRSALGTEYSEPCTRRPCTTGPRWY